MENGGGVARGRNIRKALLEELMAGRLSAKALVKTGGQVDAGTD